MYSSTSARNAVISIRLAPSRTMASRSRLRSDQSSSPTTMLNMGVPSMDGLSAALGLQQTGGYATLLSPNSIHNFGLYPHSYLRFTSVVDETGVCGHATTGNSWMTESHRIAVKGGCQVPSLAT